jgi:hypothetical protein
MRRARPPAPSWFDARVEEEVARAQDRGDFDALPGAGRPLELDDDTLVPEDLRAAYRVLRNAGFVPPEVQDLREIGELERAVLASTGEAARGRALARLNVLLARVAHARGGMALDEACYLRLVERLSRGETPAAETPSRARGDQSS